jgi:hypothetical protein
MKNPLPRKTETLREGYGRKGDYVSAANLLHNTSFYLNFVFDINLQSSFGFKFL